MKISAKKNDGGTHTGCSTMGKQIMMSLVIASVQNIHITADDK